MLFYRKMERNYTENNSGKGGVGEEEVYVES